MIIDLLFIAILNSLAIIGLWTAFQEGMIFEFVPKLLKQLSPYLQKPIFDCLPCMASVWGGSTYLVLCAFGLTPSIFFILIHICAVGGLNMLANWFILSTQSSKEFHDNYGFAESSESQTETKEDKKEDWFSRASAQLELPIEIHTNKGARFIGVATRQNGKLNSIGFRDQCESDIEAHFGLVIGWKHLTKFDL